MTVDDRRAPGRELVLAANELRERLNEVKADFVGRDEAVDLLALAVLCREHVLLLGPPGTAKTSLLERLRGIFDADGFTYLLTRFTEPAELFGPMDLEWFKNRSEYRINSKGMLPDAHLVFLDEVFQGSSAILNALLTLINERRFHDGSRLRQAKLLTLLGSSNEIPDDPALAAFSDRFLLRMRLDYVPDDDVEELLAKGWSAERRLMALDAAAADDEDCDEAADPAVRGAGAGQPARTRVGFPLAQVHRLQRAVADVEMAEVREQLGRVVRALRADGVDFSDRRTVKAQKAIAASALLHARVRAAADDLAVIAHMWADPRDESTVRRILADHDVPVDDGTRPPLELADLRLDLFDCRARVSTLTYSEEYRELLRRLQRIVNELMRAHPGAESELAEARELQRTVLQGARERFTWDQYHAEG